MNWGHKIAIAYILFVVGMLSLVYVSSLQTNEMIDENYYEKELQYQSLIDGKNNLSQFTQKELLRDSASMLVLALPLEVRENCKGEITFLRNDDKKKDKQMTLALDANGNQYFPKSHFAMGVYWVRIKWESQNKSYYSEQKILIS